MDVTTSKASLRNDELPRYRAERGIPWRIRGNQRESLGDLTIRQSRSIFHSLIRVSLTSGNFQSRGALPTGSESLTLTMLIRNSVDPDDREKSPYPDSRYHLERKIPRGKIVAFNLFPLVTSRRRYLGSRRCAQRTMIYRQFEESQMKILVRRSGSPRLACMNESLAARYHLNDSNPSLDANSRIPLPSWISYQRKTRVLK